MSRATLHIATLLLVATLAIHHLASPWLQVQAYYDEDQFRAIVYNDDSNDDAIRLNAQQLIVRSGYNYTLHYSVADDGYVTQLIRLINPLVRRADLKQPPVILMHGASLDQTAYLVASSIQHHPERYPRRPADNVNGPMTSSNRSLGFMLANNGYDVWLVGTRGSNRGNQGYVKNVSQARANYNQFELTPENYEFVDLERERYFLYGQDDVIAFELREQLDRVSELTNSSELSLFTYSLSTPTTMAFLAANPNYAHRIRVYLQQAPAIAADHFTTFGKTFFEIFDRAQPTRGVGFISSLEGQLLLREAIINLSRLPATKYTVTYEIMSQLFGPSILYYTNLELNLLAHIFQDVSHKTIKQYSQNSVSKKLTKFDYGLVENMVRYGQATPPEYNVSRVEVQHYVLIDGSYDSLADQTTTQRVIERTSTPSPIVHITAPGFNHLDFIGAVENARYVNFPVLEQLDAHSDSPMAT